MTGASIWVLARWALPPITSASAATSDTTAPSRTSKRRLTPAASTSGALRPASPSAGRSLGSFGSFPGTIRTATCDLYCVVSHSSPRCGLFCWRRSTMSRYIFSSESVSEGHPDKVCDYISDSVLDACLEQDRHSRVACETLCKSATVVLAGEITTKATLDFDKIVRQAVREIGYTDPSEPFCDTTLKLVSLITRQSQ